MLYLKAEIPFRQTAPRMRAARLFSLSLAIACLLAPGSAAAQTAPFTVEQGDRIVFVGNTFAERMQLFPHFETLLTVAYPEHRLTFRYLAWSADEVALRPRPLNFGDLHTHLDEQDADVVFAAFGMNESFGGPDSLARFRSNLTQVVRELQAKQYNGASAPRIVLLSPIAHERHARIPLDPAEHNGHLALYTEAMRAVAAETGVGFLDLFAPTRELMERGTAEPLTRNGIHLDDYGYHVVSRIMARALGLPDLLGTGADLASRPAPRGEAAVAELRNAILEKNELFFLRWRAVNGEYIYGRRKEPFGVHSYPPEMEQLERMILDEEGEISRLAGSAASQLDRAPAQ